MLTANGKAGLVVQDTESDQRPLDLAEQLETIRAVEEGLASVERGEGRPVDEAFDDPEKRFRRPAREDVRARLV